MRGGTGPRVVRVAVDGPVDPRHAPEPSNDAEHLVFAQLYATLVNIDCTGRVYAGLAESWVRDTLHGRWVFSLGPGIRFTDGRPVTAPDVVRSLRRAGLWAVALGPGKIAVPLEDAPDIEPIRFALPDLAVWQESDGWPVGAGPYRPSDPAPDGTLTLLPMEAGDSLSVIEIHLSQDRDPRDLLDTEIDVMVTSQPSAIDYADALPEFSSVPLPWTDSYVLASPAFTPGEVPTGPREWVDQLRDAVRVENRVSAPPFWWHDPPACRGGSVNPRAAVAASVRFPRIVTLSGDETANDLAARLVALAQSPPVGPPEREAMGSVLGPLVDLRSTLVVTVLSADDYRAALGAGRDVAYVLALPAAELAPCEALAEFRAATTWLDPQSLVPLLDTRRRAIVRRDAAAFSVDWDGSLRFGGATIHRFPDGGGEAR
ncbi:MAG: hypothetical protein HKM89_15815 [Gemmatimonadales bacterium]|nr:hypothetical protein [Gemmatimonadales bacterium]